MGSILAEAVDEALGVSKKKWALLLVGFLVAATLVVLLWKPDRGDTPGNESSTLNTDRPTPPPNRSPLLRLRPAGAYALSVRRRWRGVKAGVSRPQGQP